MKNLFKQAGNAWKAFSQRRAMPLRMEFSLVDHCNLNCKGCTHYCPIAPEHFMTTGEVEAALRHLAGVDDKMLAGGIYLLGGEPLLHPDIETVCRLTRRYFPGTTIKILTNGIKVMSMPPSFWHTCRLTGTILSVTIYPINIDYKAIEARCKEEGVTYEIFHETASDGYFFTKHTIDDRNPGNRHINHLRCYQVGCLTLRDGKIFPCSTAAYAHIVNARFGRHFEIVDNKDYINVSDVTCAADLERLKNRSTPFCRYCTRLEPTEWACSKREPGEWLP
ncbi:MAG: radical SAM protein [Clostridiales bacterium]|nr:radical SAM protein [Clostridiales bacterium]